LAPLISVPSSGVLYVAMVSDGADLSVLWAAVAVLGGVVAPVAEPPPHPASAPPAMASAPIAQNVGIRFTLHSLGRGSSEHTMLCEPPHAGLTLW